MSEMDKKNFYVYGHFDKEGNIFYIGKGTGRRAWSKKNRHSVWEYYVQKCLLNYYKVEIFKDDLEEDTALEIEEELIAHYGKQLINWQNYGRVFNQEILGKYWELRNRNKSLIEICNVLEKIDIEIAIDGYRKAIIATSEYFNLDWEEDSLVKRINDMMNSEKEGGGKNGEIAAIDRLTICLCKLGHLEEAKKEAEKYFSLFPYDKVYSAYERIIKRVNKKGGSNQINKCDIDMTTL